ncbi:MAG: hypothetical protein KF713_05750 [Turneriella sp.]|nr:hypothetical protein [Turneriella sp.]
MSDVERWLEELTATQDLVRINAIRSLFAETEDIEVSWLDYFATALSDPHPTVRFFAICCLFYLGVGRNFERAFVLLLDHEETKHRGLQKLTFSILAAYLPRSNAYLNKLVGDLNTPGRGRYIDIWSALQTVSPQIVREQMIDLEWRLPNFPLPTNPPLSQSPSIESELEFAFALVRFPSILR